MNAQLCNIVCASDNSRCKIKCVPYFSKNHIQKKNVIKNNVFQGNR